MNAAPHPLIVGAGLAGLLAAHAWPKSRVYEAMSKPTATHRALLRFRSDKVARLVGIDFRQVLVRKGIYYRGDFLQPSIRLANLYERKVLGSGRVGGERSIWALEPVHRWIAPDDLYAQLVEAVGDRITWACPVSFDGSRAERIDGGVINTSPLPGLLEAAGIQLGSGATFHRAPITVQRFRFPGADLFQTIYFPDPAVSVYRASMTGDVMIVEQVPGESGTGGMRSMLGDAFGLDFKDAIPLGISSQRYGKIIPIPDRIRKPLLFQLTHQRNIYSLGRFATWRNILLDDVVDDIAVIKRLLRSDSGGFDARKAAS
jgi:hypothetical protein